MTMTVTEALQQGARFCYHIPADAYVEGQGFRVSLVVEGVAGHYPTGDWPYTGGVGQSMPWFWGVTLGEARGLCANYNMRLGLSEADVSEIISASMAVKG